MIPDVPAIDTFGSTGERRLRVSSSPEYAACVESIAKIDLPTDALWALMTHPENHVVFRALKRQTPRKVLHESTFGSVYEVEQYTGWSVLWFSGEFRTKLRVHQDRRAGEVTFKLIESDIMEKFDGRWTVKPFTQQGLEDLHHKGHTRTLNPWQVLRNSFAPPTQESLLQLDQKVQPKSMPRALSGLARRIAASALKNTFEDIDAEAARVRAGKSRIPKLNEYATSVPQTCAADHGHHRTASGKVASCTAVNQHSAFRHSQQSWLHNLCRSLA